MSWDKSLFDSPRPRARVILPQPLSAPIAGLRRLTIPTEELQESWGTLLARRQTEYKSTPIDMETAGSICWLTSRNAGVLGRENDRLLHRPTPSAGALHPIELVVTGLSGNPGAWWYRANEHAFGLLDVVDSKLSALETEAAGCLPVKPSTQIWLVGDLEKVAAKYERPETLLLRDAGFLLCTLTFTATAMGLAPVPIGVTANSILPAGTKWSRPVVGLGGISIAK
jgi:SagB-type dehydrogenase family enzyme